MYVCVHTLIMDTVVSSNYYQGILIKYLYVGILNEDGSVDNDRSIKRLAQVAVAYAKAGT